MSRRLTITLADAQFERLQRLAHWRGESLSRTVGRLLDNAAPSASVDEYEAADREWRDSGEAELWARVSEAMNTEGRERREK